MKFVAEVDLVETLKESIKTIFNRNYIRIFEEVSLGYGIADIVISDLKTSTQISNKIETFLDSTDINIYCLIHRSEGLTVSEIIDITRCSKSRVTKTLLSLINSDYIFYQDDAKIIANKSYVLPFKSNFAVEAKLKDWKRALKQAYRYKWFAEYAYVVLDSYHAQNAIKNIEYFEKYNVGLASISTDGVLQRHYNPTRQIPFDLNMQILFSEKVRSYAWER